jgi:hypothetical protein
VCEPGILAMVLDRVVYLMAGCFVGLVLEMKWGVASRFLGWQAGDRDASAGRL